MPGGTSGLFPGLPRGALDSRKVRELSAALYHVKQELQVQEKLWGFPQRNTYCEWSSILGEETGELAKELNELNFGRGDRERMRAEAIQVAAVAVSILIHDGIGVIEETMECVLLALKRMGEEA